MPPSTLPTTLRVALFAAGTLFVMGGGTASGQAPPRLPEPEIRYPFVCTTARNGLGQPKVDNQARQGIAVAEEDAEGRYPMDSRGYPTAEATIVGWSRDCRVDVRVRYLYRTSDEWEWADSMAEVPADGVLTTVTTEGDTVPLIVRLEQGTINRFIYSVAMLAPRSERDPQEPDRSLWNRRLLFSLQGGVAIGHTQGVWSPGAALYEPALRLGYAIVNSTGLRTNTHYNLVRGGHTAVLLKRHFIETHGDPLYTVAVGGSGGAIQQYIYQQNHPGLFDGGVPQYSYPDMITQTIHVGDCELLEHYFERTDSANERWRDVEQRSKVLGLNAERDPVLSDGEREQFDQLYRLYRAAGVPTPNGWSGPEKIPLTECRPGWFGLTPLAMNPLATNVQDLDKLAGSTSDVHWTHWDDAREVYGVDDSGWARQTWDNEGVQYGLLALREGAITPEEFLRLNALVGGWKHASEMIAEGCPHDPTRCGDPDQLDPWSSRQMNLSPDGATPAPRTRGDTIAIRHAFQRGHVFRGELRIPLIDWRHYLEHQLDMHNAIQSFATRQRIVEAMGNHDNQLIWFTDARPGEPQADHTMKALEVLHEWIMNIRADPGAGVAENRPAEAVDRCWATDGSLLGEGPGAWAGILDDRPPGPCTRAFPLHSTSRIRAGGPIRGDVFKCGRIPVREAVSRGFYGPWRPAAAELRRLEEIFPTGVCGYS